MYSASSAVRFGRPISWRVVTRAVATWRNRGPHHSCVVATAEVVEKKKRRPYRKPISYEELLQSCEKEWPRYPEQFSGWQDPPLCGPPPNVAATTLAAVAQSLRKAKKYQVHDVARDSRVVWLVQCLRLGNHDEHKLVPDSMLAQSAGGAVPTPDQLCEALWALSFLGGPELFEKEVELLLQAVDFSRDDVSPRVLRDVMWALANSRHDSAAISDIDVALAGLGGCQKMTFSAAASLLWSFAALNAFPPAILDTLPQDWENLHSTSLASMASFLWSMTVLDCLDMAAAQAVWRELQRRDVDWCAEPVRIVNQVYQAGLHMDINNQTCRFGVHEEVVRKLQQSWVYQARNQMARQYSYYQRQMGLTLKSMGVTFLEEQVVAGYSVDFYIPSLRCVLEADGPSHRTRNTNRPLGSTVIKHRQLTLSGMTVVAVTHEAWDELVGGDAKRLFMMKKLGIASPDTAA